MADIYLTEYQRIFMHFVFRAWSQGHTATSDTTPRGFLDETPNWTTPYFTAGNWKQRQRALFAGT